MVRAAAQRDLDQPLPSLVEIGIFVAALLVVVVLVVTVIALARRARVAPVSPDRTDDGDDGSYPQSG